MRYILALWMLCSVVSAEDIFKPTGRYATTSTQRQWYLVSEPWCGSCPAAKAKFLSLGWSEDNILTMAECEAKFGFRPDHVPFQFGEPVASQKTTTSRQITTNVSQVSRNEMVAKTTQVSIYNGKAGSSHRNRGALVNHLLNEGVHSGRHTSQQLNAMTDSELDALHESDHSSKPTQQPVRIQQSACPGGNCPAPTNRAQRRGGLLRGLFR